MFAYSKNNHVNNFDPSGSRTLKNDFSDPDKEISAPAPSTSGFDTVNYTDGSKSTKQSRVNEYFNEVVDSSADEIKENELKLTS